MAGGRIEEGADDNKTEETPANTKTTFGEPEAATEEGVAPATEEASADNSSDDSSDDDDDGDLINGTPNMCDINKALGQHGLGDPLGFYGISKPRKMDNFVIVVQKEGFTCPGNEIASISVDW